MGFNKLGQTDEINRVSRGLQLLRKLNYIPLYSPLECVSLSYITVSGAVIGLINIIIMAVILATVAECW